MINWIRFEDIDGWTMGDAVSNIYHEHELGVKFGKADWFTSMVPGQEGNWVKDHAVHLGHTWSTVTIDDTLRKQIRRLNGTPIVMLCFPNIIKSIDNEHDTLRKIIDAFEPFPNVKFLFTNTWDLCTSTIHDFNIVDYILERFRNIDSERINFILCNKHIVDEIKSKRPDIDSMYFNIYFDRIMHFNPTAEFNTDKRSKHFLCLNNLDKNHRLEIFEHLPNDKSYKTYLANNITLEEENEHDQSNLVMWQDTLPHKYYHDSYINVVGETMHEFFPFYDQVTYGHLTEKSFKPMYFKQLFLVNGYHNINSELKNLGFKLFEDFIDYSFDTVAQPLMRMRKLKNELTRLSNLELSDIHEYMYSESCQDILQHNYNLFQDYRCNHTTRLTEKYGGTTDDIMSDRLSF